MGIEGREKFTWKDSNVALFGSDEDKKVGLVKTVFWKLFLFYTDSNFLVVCLVWLTLFRKVCLFMEHCYLCFCLVLM